MDNDGIDLKKAEIETKKAIQLYQAENLAKQFGATPGRKRPRNPQKKETLLRWERERGGKKIGEI